MLVQYKNALDDWKVIVLYFQIAIVTGRFLSMIGPSLQLVLEITQLAAASIIYRRPQCSPQAKYFVVVSVLLLYLLVYNFAFCFFHVKSQKQTLIVQHFKNGYQIWGYSIEFFFHIFACIVVWRSYQLALILETTDDQDLLDLLE